MGGGGGGAPNKNRKCVSMLMVHVVGKCNRGMWKCDTWNPESMGWNQGSKTVLDSLIVDKRLRWI